MKPMHLRSILFSAAIALSANLALAETPMENDSHAQVFFPDPVLESVIRTAIGNFAGAIFLYELEWVTYLEHSGQQFLTREPRPQIANLTGLEYCHNLHSLVFTDNLISDLEPLRGLSNLSTLSLSRNKIANIEPLAGLTSLGILHLSGNLITQLWPLQALDSLIRLDLRDNLIGDITPLAALGGLQMLWLGNNGITDISALAPLKHLYWLYLYENRIRDITPLQELVNLIDLNLSHNRITSAMALRGLQKLRDFSLSSNDLTSIDGFPMRFDVNNYGFGTVDFANNEISDISGLPAHAHIERLDLSGNRISNLTPLGENWLHIEKLELSKNIISDASPIVNKRLERLNLSHNELTAVPAFDARIMGPVLRDLDLSYNQISDMAGLSVFTGLRILRLSTNNITHITGLTAESRAQLHWLILDNNEIEDLSAIAELQNLDLLDVSGNAIRDITPLRHLSLRNVSAAGNQIEDLSPLREISTLEALDLSSNRISQLEHLEDLPNLRFLYLAGNALTDTHDVGNFDKLVHLRLSENNLNNLTGLSALTELEVLYIASNQFTNLPDIEGLPNLLHLDISSNDIEDISALTSLPARDSAIILSGNRITNIAPILGNPSIGARDSIYLTGNPLTALACDIQVGELRARGAYVVEDCQYFQPECLESYTAATSQQTINAVELVANNLGAAERAYELTVDGLASRPLTCDDVANSPFHVTVTWSNDMQTIGCDVLVTVEDDLSLCTPAEGDLEGASEGYPGEGTPDTEGTIEASPDQPEAEHEGDGTEGDADEIEEGAPDGVDGESEGESLSTLHSSADANLDRKIQLEELIRVVQLFNAGGYHCTHIDAEQGYELGANPEAQSCLPHTSDYAPQDWRLTLNEVLRLIQFYNAGYYRYCEGTEDHYCLER